MIAHIRGTITEKIADSLVVDVGGVGYEVAVAAGDFDTALVGQECTFYTYHHIRENTQELFGFSVLAAKQLFELLITVQGVGPKAALAILSLGDSQAVRSAIATADAAFIQKAVGVGKKTAERIVVDLGDKVGPAAPGTHVQPAGVTTPTPAVTDDAVEALMALGYNLADATRALDGIDPTLPTAQRVTAALRT